MYESYSASALVSSASVGQGCIEGHKGSSDGKSKRRRKGSKAKAGKAKGEMKASPTGSTTAPAQDTIVKNETKQAIKTVGDSDVGQAASCAATQGMIATNEAKHLVKAVETPVVTEVALVVQKKTDFNRAKHAAKVVGSVTPSGSTSVTKYQILASKPKYAVKTVIVTGSTSVTPDQGIASKPKHAVTTVVVTDSASVAQDQGIASKVKQTYKPVKAVLVSDSAPAAQHQISANEAIATVKVVSDTVAVDTSLATQDVIDTDEMNPVGLAHGAAVAVVRAGVSVFSVGAAELGHGDHHHVDRRFDEQQHHRDYYCSSLQ